MNITPYYALPGEKPLDLIKPDGGFTGIFRTIACVGDSLSSGEFESRDADGKPGYHDFFEYSWGQFIARKNGLQAQSFSRGGMTAEEYMTSYADANRFWQPERACQAYVIALGVNDIMNRGQETNHHEGESAWPANGRIHPPDTKDNGKISARHVYSFHLKTHISYNASLFSKP